MRLSPDGFAGCSAEKILFGLDGPQNAILGRYEAHTVWLDDSGQGGPQPRVATGCPAVDFERQLGVFHRSRLSLMERRQRAAEKE
jgi:hypothetical protein